MSEAAKDKTALQWHPAFYAGIQIELAEEAQHLIFENEHQLGTKPKEIDVLIIKKDPKVFIRKNIGRIFRKHNIKFIVTSQLPEEVNFWLHNLTNDLKKVEEAEKLLKEYEKYQDNNLHQSLMNIIVRANKEVFKEAGTVCEALYELMEDQFKEREEQAQQLGEKRGKELTLLSLVKDGLLSSTEAAKRLSISEEELEKRLMLYPEKI